jgi:hypothetical protein
VAVAVALGSSPMLSRPVTIHNQPQRQSMIDNRNVAVLSCCRTCGRKHSAAGSKRCQWTSPTRWRLPPPDLPDPAHWPSLSAYAVPIRFAPAHNRIQAFPVH